MMQYLWKIYVFTHTLYDVCACKMRAGNFVGGQWRFLLCIRASAIAAAVCAHFDWIKSYVHRFIDEKHTCNRRQFLSQKIYKFFSFCAVHKNAFEGRWIARVWGTDDAHCACVYACRIWILKRPAQKSCRAIKELEWVFDHYIYPFHPCMHRLYRFSSVRWLWRPLTPSLSFSIPCTYCTA